MPAHKSYYLNNALEDDTGSSTAPWSYDMKTMRDYSNAVFAPQPDDYDVNNADKNEDDKVS